ncbi:NlpC/P60 family protein [Capnocytophaga canis]|uniref:C40 family peptidase n=1 Tax=Capnocytophaga canis TaxID=1848903 RepID=UPI00370D1B86
MNKQIILFCMICAIKFSFLTAQNSSENCEPIEEKTWGVVYNSVGKIHAESNHRSEIVTEVLLGMPVMVLNRDKGWRKIKTSEGYVGWISESIVEMTHSELKEYNQKRKIIVTSLYTHSYKENSLKSAIISDLVMGNILEVKGRKGNFFKVIYPDGREAYIKKNDAVHFDKWLNNIKLTEQSIASLAQQMAGIPYVWGGTSSKGLDCSGFTKLIYFMHGVILLRDSSQQVKTGKLVDEKGDFSKLQVGDLVFFGTKADESQPQERVTHVGIYLGNGRFIHASDYVKIASFYPHDPLYDAFNTNRYLRTKRILGSINSFGIEYVRENEFYTKN